jgi:hypothetical protein
MRSCNPRRIDRKHPVTHACDQVDEKPVAMCLGQPHRIAYLALKTVRLEKLQGPRRIAGTQENVQILGIAANSCVLT